MAKRKKFDPWRKAHLDVRKAVFSSPPCQDDEQGIHSWHTVTDEHSIEVKCRRCKLQHTRRILRRVA